MSNVIELGTFDVSDEILARLTERAKAYDVFAALSRYFTLSALAVTARFTDVSVRREDYDPQPDRSVIVDHGALILLTHGFVFIPYARIKARHGTMWPLLLFGAVGGAAYAFTKNAELSAAEAELKAAAAGHLPRRATLESLSIATQITVQDSIWIRASDIETLVHETRSSDEKSGAIALTALTLKQDRRRRWTFRIPTPDARAVHQAVGDWTTHVLRLRDERRGAVAQLTDATQALLRQGDDNALADLSPALGNVCDDEELRDLYVRGVLGLTAARACRIACRLIPINWPLDATRTRTLRKAIYQSALGTTQRLKEPAMVVSGILALLAVIGYLLSYVFPRTTALDAIVAPLAFLVMWASIIVFPIAVGFWIHALRIERLLARVAKPLGLHEVS